MMRNTRNHVTALSAAAVFSLCACARTEKSAEVVDTSAAAASVMTPTPPKGNPFTREDSTGGSLTVNVAVAWDSAIIVDPANPPHTRTLLAYFTNDGPGNEKVYHFQPKAAFTYKLYADTTKDPTTGTTAWSFDQVNPGGVQTHSKTHGSFHDCKDGPHNTHANAGFKKCGVPTWWPDSSKTASSTVMKSSMLSNPFLKRAYSAIVAVIQDAYAKKLDGNPDDPAWIACTGGCCTLQQ